MAITDTINIISVPADTASIIRGKHLAPQALLDAGLATKLQEAGFAITETNALPSGPRIWAPASAEPNGARNEAVNIEVYHQVKETVSKALSSKGKTNKDGALPFQLILGGGCDIQPAILSAYHHHLPADKKVGLIYIDADTDLVKPKQPGSLGTLASMTMTHLLHLPGSLESMKPFTKANGSGVVDSESAVLFGLNMGHAGNTKEQLGFLLDGSFQVFSSGAVAADPGGRAKQALQWLEDNVDYVMVHLDVDAIDGCMFPLANIPNFTGAEFEAVMAAVEVFLGSEKVVGLTVAEVNPDHDPEAKMTTRLVDRIVKYLSRRRRT